MLILLTLYSAGIHANDNNNAEHIGKTVDQYKHGDEFSRLVRRLSYNPDDLEAGDSLRRYCRKNSVNQRCIKSLNALTGKHPKNRILRYQAALAYVDEVPGHSLFKQGWLSTRSMNHMTSILEREPDDWTARYIRGLNGLYWPRSFRKLPAAIKDLEHCLKLSNRAPSGLKLPYHGYAYIALGDAHVKGGNHEMGRQVYREGLEFFASEKMKKRIAMDDETLAQFVGELRHTDSRINTEISFLIDGGKNRL